MAGPHSQFSVLLQILEAFLLGRSNTPFCVHLGASVGVASEKVTISPQFVPITQLILLTEGLYRKNCT